MLRDTGGLEHCGVIIVPHCVILSVMNQTIASLIDSVHTAGPERH